MKLCEGLQNPTWKVWAVLDFPTSVIAHFCSCFVHCLFESTWENTDSVLVKLKRLFSPSCLYWPLCFGTDPLFYGCVCSHKSITGSTATSILCAFSPFLPWLRIWLCYPIALNLFQLCLLATEWGWNTLQPLVAIYFSYLFWILQQRSIEIWVILMHRSYFTLLLICLYRKRQSSCDGNEIT